MNPYTEDERARTLEWMHRVYAYFEHTRKASELRTGRAALASDTARAPAFFSSYCLEEQPSGVSSNMKGA